MPYFLFEADCWIYTNFSGNVHWIIIEKKIKYQARVKALEIRSEWDTAPAFPQSAQSMKQGH